MPMRLVARLARWMRELRVVVANHVPRERNHPLLRKVDAPRRRAAVLAVFKPAFVPMTVRIQNRRKRAFLSERAIQISADVKSGITLEINFLHTVAIALDAPEN